jgi:hypothetical protein
MALCSTQTTDHPGDVVQQPILNPSQEQPLFKPVLDLLFGIAVRRLSAQSGLSQHLRP